MKRYIQLYLAMAPEVIEKMGENIHQKDWDGLAVNAHSFKSQVEYMGIKSLRAVLITIEQSAKSGAHEGLVPLYEEVIQLDQQAQGLLQAELARL